MKRSVILFAIFLLFSPVPGRTYKILYAEQYYRLFHTHFYQYPADINENIWYLEQALKSDFCNPLNALAKVENKAEWEKYRYLFSMHVNLKILEQYRLLGNKFDKQKAYFFNSPWKDENLKSLQVAEVNYNKALYYWDEAVSWAKKASRMRIYLEEVQKWEDEAYRIMTGNLNYKAILGKDLNHLEKVRSDFLEMDENTY